MHQEPPCPFRGNGTCTHAKACPYTALQQADRAANTKQRNLTLKEAEVRPVGPEFRAGSSSSISALRSLCSVVFSFNVLFGKLKHPHKRRESNKPPRPYYSVSTMINFCPSLFHVPSPHAELRLCFFGVYASRSQIPQISLKNALLCVCFSSYLLPVDF